MEGNQRHNRLLKLREEAKATQEALRREKQQMLRDVARSPAKKTKAALSPEKAIYQIIGAPDLTEEEKEELVLQPTLLSGLSTSSIPAYRPSSGELSTPLQNHSSFASEPQDTIGRAIDSAIGKSIADCFVTDGSQQQQLEAAFPTPEFMTMKGKPTYCELDEPGHTISYPNRLRNRKRHGPGFWGRLLSCFTGNSATISLSSNQNSPPYTTPATSEQDQSPPVALPQSLSITIAPLRQGSATLQSVKAAEREQQEEGPSSTYITPEDVELLRNSLNRIIAENIASNPPTPRFGGRPILDADDEDHHEDDVDTNRNMYEYDIPSSFSKEEVLLPAPVLRNRNYNSNEAAAPNSSRPSSTGSAKHTSFNISELMPSSHSQPAAIYSGSRRLPASVQSHQYAVQYQQKQQQQLPKSVSAPTSPVKTSKFAIPPQPRRAQSGGSQGSAAAPVSSVRIQQASPMKKPAIEPRMNRAQLARQQAVQRKLEEDKRKEMKHWNSLPVSVKKSKAIAASPVKQQRYVAPESGGANTISCGTEEDKYMQMLARLQMGMSVESVVIREAKEPRALNLPADIAEEANSVATRHESGSGLYSGSHHHRLENQPTKREVVEPARSQQNLVSMTEAMRRSMDSVTHSGAAVNTMEQSQTGSLLDQLLRMERSLTIDDVAELKRAIKAAQSRGSSV